MSLPRSQVELLKLGLLAPVKGRVSSLYLCCFDALLLCSLIFNFLSYKLRT